MEILLTLEHKGGSTQCLYIQTKTFLFMQKIISQLYNLNLKEFNNKNAEIAQQVEEHIEILEEIKAKIVQHIKKTDYVVHPKVRYQNPDAWANPAHNAMQL